MQKSDSEYNFILGPATNKLLYKHIAEIISGDIEKGILEEEYHLPSINDFSLKYAVARDTVERAYRELKKQDYIISLPGKGYFVLGKKDRKIKILLVFNKLSSFKKIIYDAIIKNLGDRAEVDLKIHHYDPKILTDIIDKSRGKYGYTVIMPHFFHDSEIKDYLALLKSFPSNELILLDKYIPGVKKNTMSVYQDFQNDIVEALSSQKEKIKKYREIKLVFPGAAHYPLEIISGLEIFSKSSKQKFSIISDLQKEVISTGTLYIAIEDSDLAKLIKMVRSTNYKLGKQAGIISFNETDLKELLDITVITTDFEQMGKSVADMILNNGPAQIKNPFRILVRSSL